MDYDKLVIPNIYDIQINKFPLLEKLEIYFRNTDDYDIIINDELSNYLIKENTKNNRTILQTPVLKKYFRTIIKHNPVYYIQTNCNNAINFVDGNNFDDPEVYNLFDGYTNTFKQNSYIEFGKHKLCNKYIRFYFYHFNYYFNDSYPLYEKDYLTFGQKYKQNNLEDYIDIIKYFIFNAENKSEYPKYEYNTENIIKLKILDNDEFNKFDLICSINILENIYNNLTIVITPIKIIDNSNYYEIKFFDNTCNECYFNKLKQFKKYHSKSILICDKHYNLKINNLNSIFDYDIEYHIDIDDMCKQLDIEYNIIVKKKHFITQD